MTQSGSMVRLTELWVNNRIIANSSQKQFKPKYNDIFKLL